MGVIKHRRPVIAPDSDTGEMGPVGGAGLDYSATEQDTGLKWIDGRTIYQKTISGTMDVGSPTTTAHGITDLNLPISIVGVIQRNASEWVPFPGGTDHPSLIGDQILTTINATNFVMADAGSQWDSNPWHITVRYCKSS